MRTVDIFFRVKGSCSLVLKLGAEGLAETIFWTGCNVTKMLSLDLLSRMGQPGERES